MAASSSKRKRGPVVPAPSVRTKKSKLKDPQGGLTAAGRAAFKRSEGANLKPGVKNYASASPADKKRWISWASRFYGRSKIPPLKKPNGEPTRYALTANAWGMPVPQNEQQARAIGRLADQRSNQLKGKK